ncbi:GAF domain-containing protein [Hymenobacter sp. IS2118]|uniref:GAF domain-containing protein n=1 Tax=Hymenobacter sp. IS2118 TaxID=1505605 RepID=UPI000558366B|nr:GAF domain-containing protein [Hymenobacter sp. IS2118]
MSNTPLSDLELALQADTSPAEALQRALELVGQHLRADRCFLYVRDPERGRGRIALVWRLDEAVPDPRHDWQADTGELPQEDPLFRAALACAPSVFVEDVTEAGPEVLNQEFERRTFGHRALVHAHVTDGGQLWGILQPCVFGHPRHWTAAERAYVEGAVPRLLPMVQRYVRES